MHQIIYVASDEEASLHVVAYYWCHCSGFTLILLFVLIFQRLYLLG